MKILAYFTTTGAWWKTAKDEEVYIHTHTNTHAGKNKQMKNTLGCEFNRARMGLENPIIFRCLCKQVQFGQPRPRSHLCGSHGASLSTLVIMILTIVSPAGRWTRANCFVLGAMVVVLMLLLHTRVCLIFKLSICHCLVSLITKGGKSLSINKGKLTVTINEHV